MPQLKKSFPIKARDFIRAGEASINIQNLLKSMDFDPRLIRRVAICGYESEMNVVMHAVRARAILTASYRDILVVIDDEGKGIEDVEQAMQEGYTTATDEQRAMGFGSGMGLPNIKRNTDEFEITSELGRGTRIAMRFFVT